MISLRITWNEITKAYPDKWVAVANLIMDGDSPDILEGDIVAVKNDDDIDSYELNHHGKGYKYRRTTEGFFNGITGSSITISVCC